jgi:hypothetical protein
MVMPIKTRTTKTSSQCVGVLYLGFRPSEGNKSDAFLAGYSFFDSGDVELVGHRKRSPYHNIGEWCIRIPVNQIFNVVTQGKLSR